MNNNSKILCFIEQNPDDWREKLKEDYNITVKEEYPFAIFNYGIDSDFSNPIVQEARGIILDLEEFEVVCWPFRKFGNYNESYADEIDWKTARVQDKIDGSIIKMWWNTRSQKWQFSTNSTINANDAIANSLTGKTFYDLICAADNYTNLVYAMPMLNKEYTFIFELVSPETQIVIKYPKAHLYHIGSRNNITGIEDKGHFNIEWPREYPLKSIDDCISAVEKLNESAHDVKKEGFVVVDANWNRIKVKTPEYLALHRLSSNSNFSKERVIEILRLGTANANDLCNDFPVFAPYFKYYDFKMEELKHDANAFCDFTKRLYEEYSHERKAVANIIKKHRLSSIGFKSLDSGRSGGEILNDMELNKYCKFIPDYKPEDFTSLLNAGGAENEKDTNTF